MPDTCKCTDIPDQPIIADIIMHFGNLPSFSAAAAMQPFVGSIKPYTAHFAYSFLIPNTEIKSNMPKESMNFSNIAETMTNPLIVYTDVMEAETLSVSAVPKG